MTSKRLVIAFLLLIFISSGFLFVKKSSAFDCLTLTSSSSDEDKNTCRNELSQIEAQLADLLQKQKEQQKNTGTLKGDVDYLNSQIKALVTKIKARSLVIAQLKVSINEKTNKINTLSSQIDQEHESLAQLLRNTNEYDEETIVHLILSDDSISNFYSDLESYNSLKEAVKAAVDNIRGIKTQTEAAKSDLVTKQNAETDAKAQLENAQRQVAQSEAETACNFKKQRSRISKDSGREKSTRG